MSEIENKITTGPDHGKCITIQEFNKLIHCKTSTSKFSKQKWYCYFRKKKTDFDNKLKNVTPNKNELNEPSEKVKAISTKGLTKDLINKFSILNGANYFCSGIFQNYLLFLSAKKYITYFSSTPQIDSWESNRISEENNETIAKSEINFATTFVDHHLLSEINFTGYCLINNNISIPKKLINLYISYTLTPWLRNLNTDFTLNNCLFRSVKLTKNADVDK